MLKIGLRWIVSALLLLGLLGCGQTGPLVMPPEAEPVKTSQTPEVAPTPDANTTTPSK
jgi:predicted small lipoprotein YifL